MASALQVIAHSVGTWCAYEFLMLARSQGLPMPEHMFLSAMTAPDMAEDLRPWRQQESLDKGAFQVGHPSQIPHAGYTAVSPLALQ